MPLFRRRAAPRSGPHYSPKIRTGASVLLALLLHVTAWAADNFTVSNVAVDASGKDTTDARTIALAEGEKDAFAQLLLRLNPIAAPAVLAHVTPAQVSGSVRGFTVADERMAPTHYHAVIGYTFDPRQIQSLIPVPHSVTAAAPVSSKVPAPVSPAALTPVASAAAASMAQAPPHPVVPPVPKEPPAEARRSKAVLVIPVYNTGERLQLWQDENTWRNVWYDAALESGGGLVVVPGGDMNDRIDVDDATVGVATTQTLRRMYDRYGVGQIEVAQAFFNLKADPKPTLQVTIRKLLPGGPQVLQADYTIHSTETLDGLLVRASNDIARRLYREQTVDPTRLESDRPKEISARINTNSIAEWQELRQKLLMRSNILDVKFISISYYETRMTLVYTGTSDLLAKTLAASGLRVFLDNDSLVLSVK